MNAMREGLVQRHAKKVLDSERYALLSALVLAAIPFMGWLAEALIALVTMRQGARAGAKLLLPVMLVHTLMSIFSFPVFVALGIAMLNVLPCYLAAYVLKKTTSWRAVAFVLFSLVLLGSMVIHMALPSFIAEQYTHLESLLKSMSSNQSGILDLWQSKELSSHALANYLLGVQATSLVFSALIPLFLARSIQAQLFYPGGFQDEILNFRGDKTSLAVLGLLAVAAYYNQYLAMNVLPLLLFYFVLTGLSLGATLLSNMRPLVAAAILLLPLMLLSWVMLPLYLLIGVIDSLFNIRTYLTSKMKEV